ncbi:dapper homolog 3-like [Macaca thibetana thibetana]|uniref:dapper homolog 3-like n=1 Tax=Macaca thibetana thibetana TaxID=257877 RepID=UPI0021BCE5A8|nr:dapper homolog 3-like [Macaca thibetana thibetana]
MSGTPPNSWDSSPRERLWQQSPTPPAQRTGLAPGGARDATEGRPRGDRGLRAGNVKEGGGQDELKNPSFNLGEGEGRKREVNNAAAVYPCGVKRNQMRLLHLENGGGGGLGEKDIVSRKPRASPLSPRACPSQDSPRSRRRLASSRARVGGKVGQREERRDEPRSREAPAPGAARDAKPALDPGAPRLLPRSAWRFRLGRVRRGLRERACARVPGSGPPPPGSFRVLAGSRELRGRRSTPGGARCSAPPARAGTMEPELVPRRRGGGRAPVRRPGSPDLVPLFSRPRRRRLTLLADRAPSLRGGPGAAACPTAARVPCALWGAPSSDGRKSSGSAAFRAAARSRPGKARSPQCATRSPGPVRTWPCCRHSPGSSARYGCTSVPAPAHCRPPPRTPRLWPKERSERCAPARREGSPSHSHRRWSLLRLRPLPLPAGPCSSPAAAPEEGEPAERAELSGALLFSSCSLVSFGACAPASERVPEGAGILDYHVLVAAKTED